jgi:ATP-dependent RNA helicase DHX8/PRP22
MDLEKLEYLSLVSKIVTEMENHFGISEKSVAEMIIDLALNNPTFGKFKQSLLENDLEVNFNFIYFNTLFSLLKRSYNIFYV